MARTLVAERLVLRGWDAGDAPAALGAYGDERVARWLAPAIGRIQDAEAMGVLLEEWIAEDAQLLTPAGRWAIQRREDGQLVGGASLLPLAPDEEFEIGWALHPKAWGHGYATESGLALARWAFDQGIEQVIALVRPANTRATATMHRIGMEWVGETEKYHGLRLQQYRLRPGDLATARHGMLCEESWRPEAGSWSHSVPAIRGLPHFAEVSRRDNRGRSRDSSKQEGLMTEPHPGLFVSNVRTGEWEPDPDVPGSEMHELVHADGVWAGLTRFTTVNGPTPWTPSQRETIHVLEGEVTIEIAAGASLTLRPGDMASLPAGLETIWHITPPFTEFWVLA